MYVFIIYIDTNCVIIDSLSGLFLFSIKPFDKPYQKINMKGVTKWV